jgi:hypothetical protein
MYVLQNLLELEEPPPRWEATIVCYCEDSHAIFIRVHRSIYMVDLNTMQHMNLGFEHDDGAKHYALSGYMC